MGPQARRAFFERLQARNPNPQTELHYDSPFQLLIAVMLSAQATDISVNKATRTLFVQAPTAQSMIKLGLAGIKQHIKTIGLYNTKAENVYKTCQRLLEHHKGKVPETREALEALPGVGRKTANVVLNTAFRHATLAVDTHIFRVANRTGLAPGKNVLAVEHALIKRVPKDFLLDAHHWLILHGRYTCKARKPDCENCPVADLCQHNL
ncbi:MAG: endonuclease III [Gammaproteobacteria bacterium]